MRSLGCSTNMMRPGFSAGSPLNRMCPVCPGGTALGQPSGMSHRRSGSKTRATVSLLCTTASAIQSEPNAPGTFGVAIGNRMRSKVCCAPPFTATFNSVRRVCMVFIFLSVTSFTIVKDPCAQGGPRSWRHFGTRVCESVAQCGEIAGRHIGDGDEEQSIIPPGQGADRRRRCPEILRRVFLAKHEQRDAMGSLPDQQIRGLVAAPIDHSASDEPEGR